MTEDYELTAEEWAAVEADGLQSGVDTPGCDCTHDGMGRGWHVQGCAWLLSTAISDSPAAAGSQPSIDCRSEVGVTVGLADAIITTARILAHRDLDVPAVREALADLRSDEDVAAVLGLSPSPIDWRQVAVKLGQLGSGWRLLSTPEAEALRELVDEAWDREQDARELRRDRARDEISGGDAA